MKALSWNYSKLFTSLGSILNSSCLAISPMSVVTSSNQVLDPSKSSIVLESTSFKLLLMFIFWFLPMNYIYCYWHPLHLHTPGQPICIFPRASTRPLWSGLSICPALLRGSYLGGRCWQSILVSEKPDSCLKFKIYIYFGINQKWFILWVSSRPVES